MHWRILVALGLWVAVGILNPPESNAQSSDGGDSAFVDGVPHIDGVSLEGILIDDNDVVVDKFGNTRVDLLAGSKEPEPFPAELEKHLEDLAAEREQMAEALAADDPLQRTTDFEDPTGPPRMDSGDPNPDRLNIDISDLTSDLPSGEHQ